MGSLQRNQKEPSKIFRPSSQPPGVWFNVLLTKSLLVTYEALDIKYKEDMVPLSPQGVRSRRGTRQDTFHCRVCRSPVVRDGPEEGVMNTVVFGAGVQGSGMGDKVGEINRPQRTPVI